MFRLALVAALCLFSLIACGYPSNKPATAKPQLSLSAHSSTLTSAFDKHELEARFAPILHLHPQELYVPMDPEMYFERSEDQRDESFFQSSRAHYLKGNQGRTITHVSDDGRHIQYWIFSPKNGCQGGRLRYRVQGPIKIGQLGETKRSLELCSLSIHEGDWENITLQLSSDFTHVEAAYLSAHGHGNWIPASALEFKDARPYFYEALNSHAFYAKDIGFHSETTISQAMLNGLLGIEWFQVGDIISGQTSVQKNPPDGPHVIEFDTQRALLDYDDIKNTAMKVFNDDWGKTVNAKTILDVPELSAGPIEGILKIALNIALMTPELKDLSTGKSPPSPWARDAWRDFDDQFSIGGGLTFDPQVGGEGGLAFSDYATLRKGEGFHVKEIWLRSGDRIDRVCIVLDETGEMCHGGGGGKDKHLILEDGEYIQSTEFAFGPKSGTVRVFGIKFTTSQGRTLEGGKWTSDAIVQTAPKGMQLVGWYGNTGAEVDNLGSIYGTLPLH
ncbi:MAG: Vps62-related protein [Chitinophagaceae bacterium]|nr:Vps62-related protein [Oligoflexus sp.]